MIIVFVVLLAVLRAGIRRQHRASSLTCQPPSLSASVARRVLGLYARTPDIAAETASVADPMAWGANRARKTAETACSTARTVVRGARYIAMLSIGP